MALYQILPLLFCLSAFVLLMAKTSDFMIGIEELVLAIEIVWINFLATMKVSAKQMKYFVDSRRF